MLNAIIKHTQLHNIFGGEYFTDFDAACEGKVANLQNGSKKFHVQGFCQ